MMAGMKVPFVDDDHRITAILKRVSVPAWSGST